MVRLLNQDHFWETSWPTIGNIYWTPGNQRGCVKGTWKTLELEFLGIQWALSLATGIWGVQPQCGEQIASTFPMSARESPMYTCFIMYHMGILMNFICLKT